MNRAQATAVLTDFAEAQFPRACGCCGLVFANLQDWVRGVTPLGEPQSHDAEIGDWEPRDPLGLLNCLNCACGTTLALTTEGMTRPTLMRLLGWLRRESESRDLSPNAVLAEVRDDIRAAALGGGPAPRVPDPRDQTERAASHSARSQHRPSRAALSA